MPDHDWKEFVEKAKRVYHKIGAVPCPAFKNELIWFNQHGWNHLVRKGRKQRKYSEQKLRIKLSEHAPMIIRSSTHYQTHTKSEEKEPAAYFWSLIGIAEEIDLTVIVRQLGRKNKHFFSIFPSYRIHKAHKPRRGL